MLRISVIQDFQWNSCKCHFLVCDATAVFSGALTEPLPVDELPSTGNYWNKSSLKRLWEQREVLDKSRRLESLERTRKQGHREVHQLIPAPQPVNKDCIFIFKIRCSFVSSPLCNYKYFSKCNFASALQCAFLITASIGSDTVVLICVIASTCDVCPSVCQVICAEMSWT